MLSPHFNKRFSEGGQDAPSPAASGTGTEVLSPQQDARDDASAATTEPKMASLNFAGTRAIVSGAGKGIGRAIAEHLASRGCQVVGVARTQEDLDAAAREIGDNFIGFDADLCNADECADVADSAWDVMNGVDFVVNCAGTGDQQPFLEVEPLHWDLAFAVNVRAAMFLTQGVAKHWAKEPKAGPRAVVNISSVPSGAFGMPNRAAYCSSKGALNQLTKVMALELGHLCGARVNAVSPTITMTHMGREAWADPAKSGPALARIPLGRFPEPSDVADAVAWLLSDACAMVHGANVPVDGGFTAVGMACLPLEPL